MKPRTIPLDTLERLAFEHGTPVEADDRYAYTTVNRIDYRAELGGGKW